MRRTKKEIHRLVTENQGLVISAIQVFFPVLLSNAFADDLQDAKQEGCIGLLDAARSWDSSRAAFSTHAYQHVRNRVGKFLGLRPGASAAAEKRRARVEALTKSPNAAELWDCPLRFAPMESWCVQFEGFAECRLRRLGLDDKTSDVILSDLKGERQRDIAGRLGLHPQTPSNLVRRHRGIVDWHALASDFLAERLPA